MTPEVLAARIEELLVLEARAEARGQKLVASVKAFQHHQSAWLANVSDRIPLLTGMMAEVAKLSGQLSAQTETEYNRRHRARWWSVMLLGGACVVSLAIVAGTWLTTSVERYHYHRLTAKVAVFQEQVDEVGRQIVQADKELATHPTFVKIDDGQHYVRVVPNTETTLVTNGEIMAGKYAKLWYANDGK